MHLCVSGLPQPLQYRPGEVACIRIVEMCPHVLIVSISHISSVLLLDTRLKCKTQCSVKAA